ncbi:MAG: type VI secretion system tube protein Hcp [Acidobacteria bacterium]|nr:type VI secretion system tube protein Hcp [Acidobacteriota bacterium]
MADRDYFLKIDGIEGESQDSKHKGEIQLDSFSWEANNDGTFSSNKGGGSGKVAMRDFKFTMDVNKSSPKLILACATGQHIKSAVLTCRKAGKGQQDYLTYTLSDVLVSYYRTATPPEGNGVIPRDEVGLNFAKIEVEYKEQNADGTLGGAVKVGYDLKQTAEV